MNTAGFRHALNRPVPGRRAPIGFIVLLLVGLLVGLLAAPPAFAHCDGLDGPVVTAARQALASGDVARVLIWVRPEDEDAVRRAFRATRAVREGDEDARALADRYFFETLVRLHRAGEGAPYTGLKPAGRDLGPAIPAADAALEAGSATTLQALLVGLVRDGIRARFARAAERKGFAPDDVAAGRAYVAEYVAFIHYVERLYEAAVGEPRGHYPEPGAEHAAAE